jgi:putative transcriptional regulator
MRFQPLAVLGRRSCAVLLAALLTPILAPAVAETPPGKGQFLVAAREMNDPNFNKTVILLLRYDTDGAMGLIINRPTTVLPEQVVRNVDGLRNYGGPLFVGGRVQLNVVTFLVRGEDTLERGAYVRDDLQYSGNSELLAELTATATDAGRLRVYAGYSGWAPGQLDVELARGGWHVVPGDTAMVFSENPEAVWEALVPRQAPLSAGLYPAAIEPAFQAASSSVLP